MAITRHLDHAGIQIEGVYGIRGEEVENELDAYPTPAPDLEGSAARHAPTQP